MPEMKVAIKKLVGIAGLGFMGVALLLTGCSKKKETADTGFPKGFNNKSDSEKVAYVMRTSSPDSVARFVKSDVASCSLTT